MQTTPIVEPRDLAAMAPLRLVHVATGAVTPAGVARVPIDRWIARARQSRSGLDDLAFWQEEIAALGLGPDALSVVLDDGQMTEAPRVWFILQHFGLPAAVLKFR